MNTPVFVVFPGASLMDVTPVAGGLRVECPGCGAMQVFTPPRNGEHQHWAFTHEDECPVHARIEAAIARYERRVVRRG